MDQQPKRSWWGRNWKWIVPIGCLTPVVLCGGAIALIVSLVFGVIKSSDVYAEAVDRAKTSAEVRTLLGEPVEAGYWVAGNLETSGATGKADLTIPLSGPKGSATLHVSATKAAGKWQYTTLEVAPQPAGERIDLRPKAGP